MRTARQISLVLLVVGAGVPPAAAQSSNQDASAGASTAAADLTHERTLFDESKAACMAFDYATAREKAAKAVTSLLARPEVEQDGAWLSLLDLTGYAAWYAQDPPTANSAWKRVYEVRLATLRDEHADLQMARENLAGTIKALGDPEGARVLEEKVLQVRSRTLPDDHPDLQWARGNLASTIKALGDLEGARALEEKVLEVRTRTLSDDHFDLQTARQNLALTLFKMGDHAGARPILERVFEIRSRTLTDDDPDLRAARGNLARVLSALGEHSGARALQEKELESCSRTLPEDHRDVQRARLNLARTVMAEGDLLPARALQEKAFEVLSSTLPDEHPELLWAREGLAMTIFAMGEYADARAMLEEVLEVRSHQLPADDPDLQATRGNLAQTIEALGYLEEARALQEEVLEVLSSALPDDHASLQTARAGLATTLYRLGDLQGARSLQERVFEVRSGTLPDDHRDLQSVRLNLAGTIKAQGDLASARALEEKVLDVLSRTLPDNHFDLQWARGNLAGTMIMMGDVPGARPLEEKVLEVRLRALPDDHFDLQVARGNLASTMKQMGDVERARALEEKVLEVLLRTLPDDHPALQWVRGALAASIGTLGDLPRARVLQEKVLEVRSHTLPDDHPDLQLARGDLVVTITRQLARAGRPIEGEGERTREWKRCAELIGAMCRSQVHAARDSILASPVREAEERCSSLVREIGSSLSFALGLGVFEPVRELEPQLFVLAETTRGAALASAGLTRRAAHSPKYSDLRDALREASGELVALAQKGATSEEFDRARVNRESVERELVALASELSGGSASGLEFDVASLAARLTEHEAAISYRRFMKSDFEVADVLEPTGQPEVRTRSSESLCAFVLRREEGQEVLRVIELGPIGPIEGAVTDWLDRLLGVTGRGLTRLAPLQPKAVVDEGRTHAAAISLRELVFDPLLPALDGVDRLVVVMDDVLHAVPIDALPLTPPESRDPVLLGDRYTIEQRRTLLELLFPDEPPAGDATLLALGGASFDAPPLAPDAEDAVALDEAPAPSVAGLLRGGAWNDGFTPLPETGPEAQRIAARFKEAAGDAAQVVLLDDQHASRASVESLSSQARWLHLATHGWFAPESIRSWDDPGPLDHRSGLGVRMSAEERIVGSSPMVLCGLALAGANLPADAIGRFPGLVTAEEMSTWDLTNCELAVLSACDTNVGVRRVGQGVASLQKALHMAGARSVITSLWKVPDDATKELMLDFYRRLWVEKKPKHHALWEAKMQIRDARGADGQLAYSTRDWAAWVLTGDPD